MPAAFLIVQPMPDGKAELEERLALHVSHHYFENHKQHPLLSISQVTHHLQFEESFFEQVYGKSCVHENQSSRFQLQQFSFFSVVEK